MSLDTNSIAMTKEAHVWFLQRPEFVASGSVSNMDRILLTEPAVTSNSIQIEAALRYAVNLYELYLIWRFGYVLISST